MANWREGYEVSKIVSRIEACKKLGTSGVVSFQGFGFIENVAVLYNMLDCSKDIPDSEKHQFIRKAVDQAGKAGKITPDSILQEIRKLEIAFLRKPLARYVLATSISAYRFLQLRKVRIKDAFIIFEANLPERFLPKSRKLIEVAKRSIYADPPNNYMQVRICVYARSPFDAANKAFEAIDLLRGIWNFYLNLKQPFRETLTGDRKPVNHLVLGPLHTLHFPSGELATEMWWYDVDYQKALSPSKIKRDLKKMYEFEQKSRKLLSKIKYQKEITNAIIEYGRALDNRNWRTAFLRLWNVIEELTHTCSDGYKVTIRRASFVFKDPEYHRQILNHLRDLRNSFVHAHGTADNIETYLYQLKRYVETLLYFHLSHGPDFENIGESAYFLDMPSDIGILETKLRLLNKAKRYLL